MAIVSENGARVVKNSADFLGPRFPARGASWRWRISIDDRDVATGVSDRAAEIAETRNSVLLWRNLVGR
jgi:hypothetical protein